MSAKTLSVILDVILVLAAVWMIVSVRGLGGIVGRTVGFIVVGALITGLAHLFATVSAGWFDAYDGVIHRIVVLIGFMFLVVGFRELQTMKR